MDRKDLEFFPVAPARSHTRLALLLVAALAFGSAACTTIDPVTGEEKIDPWPTAAAAVGAAAVGALIYTAADDDDDDDGHYRRGYKRGYRPFSPAQGVWCYPDQQRCYNEDGYAKKWTRRVFED